MLKLILLEDPRERERFLFSADGEKDRFLVSDIKSKMEAEERLVKKNGFLSGAAVIRMRDFLKELFERTCPGWQAVSKDFFKEFFLRFAARQNESWIKNIQNPSDFLTCFEEFLPLLSHPESSRLLKEWFEEKGPTNQGKPAGRFHLMERFFTLIQEKQWIFEEGIKGLLLNKLPDFKGTSALPGRIVADLGVHFDFCEQEILKTLASFTEVTVLIPLPEKKAVKISRGGIDAPPPQLYKLLRESVPPSAVQTIEKNHRREEGAKFFKTEYDSALMEVKGVTAQVRKWLSEGVKERDIALIAPDMESYWFCLEPYLQKENIKVKKSVTVPIGDLPEIIFWTASLKTHIGRGDFPRLESLVFHKSPKLPFSRFQSWFFRNPERDLSNRNFCKKNRVRDPEQEVSGREFIKWALSFWPENAPAELFDRVSAVFQDVPLEEKLPYQRWVMFLETGLYRREKEIKREHEGGISCLSLNALNSVRASHVIVMDLSEESLRNPEESFLNQRDLERFTRELGFPLSPHREAEKETALRWFFQSSSLKTVGVNFSAGDFRGEIRTPSAFFLLFENFYPSTQIPPRRKESITVWDSLKQRETAEEILHPRLSPSFVQKAAQALKEDRKGLSVPFAPGAPRRLSAGALHEYGTCGFKYAARYAFYMKKDPLVEWEISPLEVGGIFHGFLKKLLFETSSLEISEEKMEELAKEVLSEVEEGKVMNTKQRLIATQTLKLLGRTFLKTEKERRERHPSLKPHSGEKEIDCRLNEKTGRLDRNGAVPFKGRMDRVDFDSEHQTYVIWDYKKNLNNSTHIKHWLKKSDFQLTLYAEAVERGLVEGLPPAPVSAVAYYGLKNFDFKGYVDKTGPYREMLGKRSGAVKDPEIFKEHRKETSQTIRRLVSGIQRGVFFPEPKNRKSCDKCNWRKWCRAVHLNY